MYIKMPRQKFIYHSWFTLVIIMSLFSCFQKKDRKDNLASWLEKKFPGQMDVVRSTRDLHLKNFYQKKVTSIVAAKDDPEVQFKIIWYKDDTDLGITSTEIETSLSRSRIDVSNARKVFDFFNQIGIERTSVGVIGSALYILPFTDEAPASRDTLTSAVLDILKKQEGLSLTSIWIEWMEDSIYGKEFKDIIPDGYWHRGDSWHERHKIMSLDFEWTADLKAEDLINGWAFNTQSDRAMVYLGDAHQQASKWADKNLNSPFYLEGEQMIRFEPDQEDPMAIRYSFPFFNEKMSVDSTDFESKIKGYVTGVFQTDQKTFSKIKKVNDI